MSKVLSIASLLVLLLPAPGASQWLPSEPVRLFEGRVRLGGEVSATIGSKDDEAYFNYTEYERNVLRTVRAALSAQWQPAERLAFLGEVRTDDLDHLGAYAAFVRVRLWRRFPLDVQAGRIPPVFGAFGRRAYQSDRMLIGYPLAYQYLTSIRADALPGGADDLLRMRGRGWLSSFPIGSAQAAAGLPLVSAFRWDTGVQARWTASAVDAAVAITSGTLANPRVRDDNGGKQIAGRIGTRPVTGLLVGASAARGPWVADDVPGASQSLAQTAVGADIEYSRDHWLVRSELVWSRWDLPLNTIPAESDHLSALATWIEGRYRWTPRLYLAARVDRLGFARISGELSGGVRTPWEAPVTRLEAGAGYSLARNLVLRAVLQRNHREGGRIAGCCPPRSPGGSERPHRDGRPARLAAQ
ncbi:MAG: hypothetical protein H0W08_14365 [Acidobacteria bacterium]|nr:hypothetical protein [Acidobacteriota bacterium]